MNIYYEAWQIQCCGKPFKIGDRVRWSCAVPADKGKNICAHKVDFNEEHHGDETHSIVGTITEIVSVVQTDSPHRKSYEFDESKITLINLVSADGFESEKNATNENYYIFWGYIVSMKDVEITDYDESLQYDYD